MPNGGNYQYRNEVIEVAQCIECLFFRQYKDRSLFRESNQHVLLNTVLRIARCLAKKIVREGSVHALIFRKMMEQNRARDDCESSSSTTTATRDAKTCTAAYNPWSFAAAA